MTNEEGQPPFERPDLRLIKGEKPDSTEFDELFDDEPFEDDPIARKQAAQEGTHPSARRPEKPIPQEPNND